MALQGFVESEYLAAKLAKLQQYPEWQGKTTDELMVFMANVGFTPEQHYQQFGWTEGLAPNNLFNAAEYKLAKATTMFNNGLLSGSAAYATIDAALAAFNAAWTADPYLHYIQHGSAEGVNPSNAFDESSYLASKLAVLQANHPEVWTADKTVDDVKAAFAAAGLSALGHYQEFGKDEGIVVTEVPADEKVDVGTIDNPGQTFTLTVSADTFTGGAGNDTFNANVVADNLGVASVETLTGLDVIDGGDGTDTLNYTTVGATALPAATISNVEVINVVSDGAATADVSGANISGITTLNAKATGAAVDIDTKANVTSVTVTGTATTVAIDDAGTAATSADKITTVSVTGNTGVLAIGADSLTSLSLAKTNQNATVTAAAATRALTLNLNEVTGGIIQDATATTLTVNASGVKSSGVTLNAAAATAVSIAADETLGVSDVNIAAAKTLTVTGDSLVTIAATATVTALESVSSAASTGGVSITPALGVAVAFSGGAGKDSITLGATTKAITTGAGNDTVTMSGAVGVGGSVDAGDDIDTLSMTSADAATVSAGTTFETGISNFEKVSLASTGAANVVNMANLDDINYLVSAGVTAGGLSVTNLLSGGTFEQTGVIGFVSSVAVKDAASGGSDVLNIKLNGSANIVNTAALTVASVETINIEATDSSADTTTLTNPSAASTILLAAADATKIVVTGNHGVNFTGSTLTNVVELDAAGVVSVGNAAGATAAQIGTTGAVTFSSVVDNKAVTVTTGNGADVISTASVNDVTFLATGVTASTISTGAGNDIITGSAGKDVIDGGEGNDTITGGAASDTLTGGAGNDTFVMTSVEGIGTDSTLANLDTIIGFNANTFGNGTAGAAGTGAGADSTKWTGDVLKFDVAAAVVTDGAYVSVQSNASDAQTYLQNLGSDTAAAVDNAFGAALDSSTGRLYVDLNSDGTVDSVIQLNGVTTIDAAAFVLA